MKLTSAARSTSRSSAVRITVGIVSPAAPLFRRLGRDEQERPWACRPGVAVGPAGPVEVHADLARELVAERVVEAKLPGCRIEPHEVDATVAVETFAGDVDRVVGNR